MSDISGTDFLEEIGRHQAPPERIIADGQIHRYGPKKALWYVLHLDGVAAGAFGDWRDQDEFRKWCAKGSSEMTEAERTAHRERMERIRRERDEERQRLHEKVRAEAGRIWSSAQAADPEHPYLKRKQVQPHNLRQTQRDGLDVLLVEARDADGTLWNLQRTYPDGRKLFLKGGRKQGCFHTIGEASKTRIVCEGIATAASLHEATGHCVHSAFDCGNLKPVAEAIRTKYPEAEIVIAADDDHRREGNPGRSKAEEAARAVNGRVALPDFGPDRPDEATDFNDLAADQGLEAVRKCIEDARPPRQVSEADPDLERRQRAALEESGVGDPEGGDSGSPSAAKQVVALIRKTCELFTDTSRTPFARINGSGKVLRLGSDEFREWVLAQCWELDEFVPGESAVRSALTTAKGLARNLGDERRVFMRIARGDDAHYLDLGGESGRAVRIVPGSWEVVEKPPVMFHRTQNMRPLPEPDPEGDFKLLWSVVNVPEKLRNLLAVLLCEWLRENTTHPLLELVGEQGSGKSWVSRCLRAVIDPNRVPLRSVPRQVEGAFITASNGHLLTIENASKLSNNLQDALCALATGGGYATRRLYTDSDEAALDLCRPVMLNGIDVLVTRTDLLDRTIHLSLPRLERRTVESSLEGRFERDRPKILGGLLNLFANALQKIPDIDIPPSELPRLGDFAVLGEAVYQTQGREPGGFLADFNESRKNAVLRVLEASPLGQVLTDYFEGEGEKPELTGTMQSVLRQLHNRAPDRSRLPQSAKSLADRLRRLAPALRECGIEVDMDPLRRPDGYHVTIRRIKVFQQSSSSSSSSWNEHPDPPNPELHELHELDPKSIIQQDAESFTVEI